MFSPTACDILWILVLWRSWSHHRINVHLMSVRWTYLLRYVLCLVYETFHLKPIYLCIVFVQYHALYFILLRNKILVLVVLVSPKKVYFNFSVAQKLSHRALKFGPNIKNTWEFCSHFKSCKYIKNSLWDSPMGCQKFVHFSGHYA